MKCIIFAILLAAVAHSQMLARHGPGGFGPGGRGGFGPVGGVGGFPGRPGFGPMVGRGLVRPGVGVGVGAVGVGAVGVMPVMPAAVVPVVPVARVMPAVVATPFLGVGIGPRAVAVARTRVIVGRSVPEEFKFSYLPKMKQIELFFGQQRIACDVELRDIKSLETGVYNVTAFESSRVDLKLVRESKPVDISIYWNKSIIKPGLFVKSKICYENLFGIIRDEFKTTRFDLIVA